MSTCAEYPWIHSSSRSSSGMHGAGRVSAAPPNQDGNAEGNDSDSVLAFCVRKADMSWLPVANLDPGWRWVRQRGCGQAVLRLGALL